MKIVISDVHFNLKNHGKNNIEKYIGLDVTNSKRVCGSMHGNGSVVVKLDGIIYPGVYLTCLDDEGYPLS